jgi:hypothetical protein
MISRVAGQFRKSRYEISVRTAAVLVEDGEFRAVFVID